MKDLSVFSQRAVTKDQDLGCGNNSCVKYLHCTHWDLNSNPKTHVFKKGQGKWRHKNIHVSYIHSKLARIITINNKNKTR